MIYSILHSALQVWALVGLLSVFITTLMLWRRVRTKMRNYYSQSGQTASAYGENQGSSRTRMTRHWLIILPLMTGLSLMGNMWLIWREFHPHYAPLETKYADVWMLEKLDTQGYSWWAEKADGPFRIDFCRDYDVPSLNFQPGEVAWRFWFRDTGSCWSIKDGDVRFYRDKKRWTVPSDVSMDYKSVLKGIKANE